MKKLKCVFIIIFLIIAFTTVVSISKCQENELGSAKYSETLGATPTSAAYSATSYAALPRARTR